MFFIVFRNILCVHQKYMVCSPILECEKIHTGSDHLRSHNLRFHVDDQFCYPIYDQFHYIQSLESRVVIANRTSCNDENVLYLRSPIWYT